MNRVSFFLVALTHLASSLPPNDILKQEDYSFEQFVDDFDKSYASNTEYELRRSIFAQNLDTIVHHNNGDHHHTLGINAFCDLRPEELPTGLVKKNKSPHMREYLASSSRRRLIQDSIGPLLPLSDLPDAVDWRTKGVTTPVKSQGLCGSCWAFATTAVLESHVALATNKLFELSMQELVSCVPNPRECGGQGGCQGSIAELALDYIQKHGMVQEWDFGYQSFHGKNVTCSLQTRASSLRGGNASHLFKGAVATVAGYVDLEPNNYLALMNAVARMGPVAVSVAASPWHFYQRGVFSAELNTTRQCDVNHLVSLEGYGTDSETGEDYWLVRNSWSPLWGEGGYIRLKRVDPSTDPDANCGMDVTPDDGNACAKDKDGHEVLPPAEKICGTSGILSAATVPVGAHLL